MPSPSTPGGAKKPAKPQPKKPASSGRGSGVWIVLIVAAVVLVAGIVAILAATSSDDDDDGAGSAVEVEQNRPVTVTGDSLPEYPDSGSEGPDPAIGLVPPALQGESFSGAPVNITPGASGNPSVIVVVAHWCPHCQVEVPRIVDLKNEGKIPANIDISTVSTSVAEEQGNYPPSEWLADEEWPYTVLADSTDNTAAKALGTKYYPYLIWLDADGKVVARTTGETPADTLAVMFQQLSEGTLTATSAG